MLGDFGVLNIIIFLWNLIEMLETGEAENHWRDKTKGELPCFLISFLKESIIDFYHIGWKETKQKKAICKMVQQKQHACLNSRRDNSMEIIKIPAQSIRKI